MVGPQAPKSSSALRLLALIVVLLGVAAGGFLVGYATGFGKVPLAPPLEAVLHGLTGDVQNDKVDPELIRTVWTRITSKYIEQPVDERKLFYGALSGIVRSLDDPYSTFLTPELTKNFQEELGGSFEGIGAEIGIKDDQLTIIAPLPDSPAARAGLKAGDRVLKIDDRETPALSLEEAVSLIRGKKGTDVRLTIGRAGTNEPFEVTIRRSTITVTSVQASRRGDVGYIRVAHFNESTVRAFQSEVRKLLLVSPKGIVIDLRNNPGGFLSAAVDLTGLFLDEGQLVVTEALADGQKREHRVESPPPFASVKLVILVNEGSASAAEIVAGAIQDAKRGTLVGEQTFGKGTVQDFEELRDGSSLKLTVARWLTPAGRAIDKTGIPPDIIVTRTPEDEEAGRDPQLDRAIGILEGEESP